MVTVQPEQSNHPQTEQPTASSRPNDIQRINILEQLIVHNYMQPISIDDFADKLHIGIRQLARIVEKHYGKSLHRVIMDKRLESAENLLLHSDLTIEKIAVSVGFNSKASFYREFSRKHRMTPAQYRDAENESCRTTDAEPPDSTSSDTASNTAINKHEGDHYDTEKL